MALTDNLISYWKLDEASGNATDSVGSNTLTDNNTVTSAAGKINTARQFTAANSEYLSIVDNAALSTGDIDFTFSAWVNLASKGALNSIISKWSTGEYVIWHVNAADRFEFSVYTGAAQADVIANNLGSPSLATWYFIVAWHDSVANTINIQVNNGTVDSTSHAGGVADAAGPFNLGAFGGAQFFDGLIDEVGFWKRVLTAQERTDLYNAGAGLAYPFTPAVAAATTVGRVPRNMQSPVGRVQRRMGHPVGRVR